MKSIKITILYILILIFVSGCQSMKETLSLKKKQTVDEFLIEKKNPLVVPQNFQNFQNQEKKKKRSC